MTYKYADILAGAVGFSLMGILRPDEVLMFTYLLIYPYLYLTSRSNRIKYLLLSSFMAFIWVHFASEEYHYKMEVHSVVGLSAFPLFAWSLGLFGLHLIYQSLACKSFKKDCVRFTLLYWSMLLLVETVGYHIFNIQVNAEYPGLPMCDCLHAPVWMQIAYFAIGPLYYTLCFII